MLFDLAPEPGRLFEVVPFVRNTGPAGVGPGVVPADHVAGNALRVTAGPAPLFGDALDLTRGFDIVDVAEHILEAL